MSGARPSSLDRDSEDAVVACADLIGRAGARGFEIGYLHDDVPAELAGWYAHATFRGARITVEDQPGPVQAAEGLARRILTGGQCRCGKLTALDSSGAVAFESTLVNGERWTPEMAIAAGQCLWRRVGRRWEPSCPVPEGRSR
jgi:hypothetical protein